MWSLRQKKTGEFYLTYDRERRPSSSYRGSWEYVGPQSNTYTPYAIRVNQNAGLLCANDDEGNVRVLVLTD